MEEKHAFKTSYQVGERIKDNAYEASVVYGDVTTIEASVLFYPTFLEAEQQRNMLIDCRKKGDNFVARPLFAVLGDNKGKKGLLFIEKVCKPSSKVGVSKNLHGICIGFSDAYKNVIQGILLGYHAIYEAGHALKSLERGLFYDESGIVKLCNLHKVDSKVKKLVPDFNELADHIASFNLKAPEIDSYIDLLKKFKSSDDTEQMNLVKFLYYGPMLWAPHTRVVFIGEMTRFLSRKNLPSKADFCAHTWDDFTKWFPKAAFASIEDYRIRKRDGTIPEINFPSNFMCIDVLKFVVKCLRHRQCWEVPFDEIETEFPNICSVLYSWLAMGQCYGQCSPFPPYEVEKVFFRDLDYNGSISIGDYLLNKLSDLQRNQLGLS